MTKNFFQLFLIEKFNFQFRFTIVVGFVIFRSFEKYFVIVFPTSPLEPKIIILILYALLIKSKKSIFTIGDEWMILEKSTILATQNPIDE